MCDRFTDEKYYDMDYSQYEYIAGEELIQEFLGAHFDDELVDKFYLRGLHPHIWKTHAPRSVEASYPNNKQPHITDVCRKFNVPRDECILFDDSSRNAHNADGFVAAHVDARKGFLLSDMWERIVQQ